MFCSGATKLKTYANADNIQPKSTLLTSSKKGRQHYLNNGNTMGNEMSPEEFPDDHEAFAISCDEVATNRNHVCQPVLQAVHS